MWWRCSEAGSVRGHVRAHGISFFWNSAVLACNFRAQTAAEVVGRKIAEKCKEMGVEKVVFDRGGFLYHGRVAVSDDKRLRCSPEVPSQEKGS